MRGKAKMLNIEQLSCLTRSIVYSFPAFLRVLFLEFKALARILFLADLAFLSLNLSKSVRPALLALTAILLAQVELAQVSSTLLATSSALTILVGALKGNFTAIGVSCSCLMGYAWRRTPLVGPSTRTRFWSITLTMAAILPWLGPSPPRTATRPTSTNFLKGIVNFSLVEVNQAIKAWSAMAAILP